MTVTEALKKSCPLHRSSLCEASKCMAWQSTSQDNGFCQMVSRSRTIFIAPASPSLRVGLASDEPLGVSLVQGDYDFLNVAIRN